MNELCESDWSDDGRHTRGPWRVHDTPYHQADVVGPKDEPVAAVFGATHLEGRANANVVAAAWEMMEALKDLLTRPTDSAARVRARAAIAKAEGRSR